MGDILGKSSVASRLGRGLAYGVAGIAGLVLLAAGGVTYTLIASKPMLDGAMAVTGLSAPVTITRDNQGVPTIQGATRADLARALGFLHGQERFFQMDLIRRASAGELSGLLGPIEAVMNIDRQRRLHRFRHRAEQAVANASPEEKALLSAYAEGVNEGLSSLGARPFEYALLLSSPRPWQPADSILAGYSMYLDLQDDRAVMEQSRATVLEKLGPDLTAFLYPGGTALDSAIDGSILPAPPLPAALPPAPAKAALDLPPLPPPTPGSNAWAVGGGLTDSGAALVANDMHLGISVPGTWYRARLVQTGGEGGMDITGVTLPGTPMIIVGANGHIAWGYTNSYIDTADRILLDPVPGQPDQYQTPEGPKPITQVTEKICPAWTGCTDLVVEETIWGPVIDKDAQGRRTALRWTAHEPDAVRLGPMARMERARSVEEAITIAHEARQPQQNFVVGDAAGAVAWTIIGAVPARYGHDGTLPTSWADGSRGWHGMLPPEKVPVVLNPEHQRIWTANARIVGGEAYALLGDGGYDMGARQGQIRDELFAKTRLTPADMLAIQLDDRGLVLDFWQGEMLAALQTRTTRPGLAAMVDPVKSWGGRAIPESIGYRLVREFRSRLSQRLYGAYLAADGDLSRREIARQMEAPLRRLLTERPPALVPAPYKDWDALIDATLADVAQAVEKAGGIDAFTWGARNNAGVKHPLARLLPPLSALTDPEDVPVPGDALQPRAQAPGFGASERFAVSPGREKDGYFHMPGSQSGNPLSPYYLAGHQDWVRGRPSPFLPGPARWTLTLKPAT